MISALLGLWLFAAPVGVEGRLWLEGDSTLHRYRIDAREVQAVLEASEDQSLQALVRSHGIRSLEVKVPVAKLTSGENEMDQNLRRALLIGKQPQIVFRLDSYQLLPASNPEVLVLELHGKLAIAGTERPVVVLAEAAPAVSGLRVTGRFPVSMAEFGVKAPVLMLGMLKTADEVVVNFEFQLH
jgi:hypothetical protein